jgi:hypothetical protein
MRFLKRVAVIATVVLTLLGVGATAANATSSCPAGKFCTFWDATGGAMYYYTPVGGCIEVGYPWDDNSSSYYNRSSYGVKIYPTHGCGFVVNQYIHSGDWLIEGYEFNDTMSSFYFIGA